MRSYKAFSLSFILLVGVFYSAVSKPVIIKGQLVYKGTNTKAYIYKCLGNTIFKFDSVQHKSGAFVFKFAEPVARGFYKIGFEEDKSIVFILGSENISIIGDPDNAKSVQITGSKENDEYKAYQKINDFQSEQMSLISQKAQEIQKQPGMTEQLFNEKVAVLREKQDSLNKLYNKKMGSLIAANQSLFMTKVITMFITEGKTADNFFAAEEFTDKEYSAGDMLPSKIQMYYQYVLQQDLSAWKTSAVQLLAKCPAGSDNKEVFYTSLAPLFIQNDVDFAKVLLTDFNKEYPGSSTAKAMLAGLPKGAPAVGDEAPDISLTDADGKTHSLSSLKGKVILLDFWASWCGPCRGENPNVVNAYSKYKDKGFTVFSVSLDTNKDQWIAAIKKDGLVWPNHVSDLKGWKSDPAQLYAVRGIPSTFLIDQDGKVIATNLRGEDLQAKLEQLLNKP
ncbi:MAG: AhpC/TSA family protein [Cytophagales bacterium]|nr:AhpC/TSA family protein [Cytophaga sp.]